ncbi:MAG: hypothetical protein ACR2KX_05110 [Chitinophagaceae bacterium]
MKRIVISSCLFLFMLTATQVNAQDKIKEKEDKTKVKDGNYKEKNKEDKTKIKDDNYKEKDKDDKTKIKDGDSKTKIKNGDQNIKTDGMNSDRKMKPDSMNSQMNSGMNSGTANYTASYSSNFVIGNPAHTKMIVDLWKDWDDNAFDRHDYMADTLVMYLPDGTVTKGKAANAEGAKKFRGGLTSSKSTIDAMIPLRSTDRNEDWVAMWGTETNTWPDGKVETRQIHEVWRINKDGKVNLMRQFAAKPEQKN